AATYFTTHLSWTRLLRRVERDLLLEERRLEARRDIHTASLIKDRAREHPTSRAISVLPRCDTCRLEAIMLECLPDLAELDRHGLLLRPYPRHRLSVRRPLSADYTIAYLRLLINVLRVQNDKISS